MGSLCIFLRYRKCGELGERVGGLFGVLPHGNMMAEKSSMDGVLNKLNFHLQCECERAKSGRDPVRGGGAGCSTYEELTNQDEGPREHPTVTADLFSRLLIDQRTGDHVRVHPSRP